MNWVDNIIEKLNTMRSATIALSNSECDPMHQSISEDAYNDQFDALIIAVNTYINTTGNRKQQLEDIITFNFINELRGELSYDPDIITKPHAPSAPLGYSNYRDLFNLNNLADTIMSYDNDYYFEGCITVPSGTTSKLQADIATATSAETSDTTKRNALIQYFRGFASDNSFKFLVELIQTTGTVKSKSVVGTLLYNDKGAKDIIEKLNIDVYIPNYI